MKKNKTEFNRIKRNPNGTFEKEEEIDLFVKVKAPKRTNSLALYIKELEELRWTAIQVQRRNRNRSRLEARLQKIPSIEYYNEQINFYENRKQNCIVKFRYGNNLEKHKAFAVHYLQQDKKKLVEDKPELFTKSDKIVDKRYLEDYLSRATEKFYKFIISPERQDIEMKSYIRGLVQKMEAFNHTKYDWLAAIHNDTGHIHCHLLINGKDAYGNTIGKFKKQFIKKDCRDLARDLATEILGCKTPEEIEKSKKKFTRSTRYIDSIDSKIEKKIENKNGSFFVKTTDPELIDRLNFLSTINIAAPIKGVIGGFTLTEDWKSVLVNAGRYNAFLKARIDLLKSRKSVSSLSIYTDNTGPISGKVVNVFRKSDNEEIWTNAIVVLDEKQNKAFYVPLFYEPNENIKIDTNIGISLTRNSKGLLTPKIRIYPSSSKSQQR